MSQLEQRFYAYLNRNPSIRACYAKNLINVRALARSFIKEERLQGNLEAIIAMIRRSEVAPLLAHTNKKIFSEIKISVKDEISILDYEKSKFIVEKLKDIVTKIDYDKNETLKVVVGSHSVKIIVDTSLGNLVKNDLGRKNLRKEYKSISEISLLFPAQALDEKGVAAYITSELLQSGINIRELITCTPEMIIYFDENQSINAYEVFKRIKQISST